ncbi:transcriptional regulator medusa [Trichoderma cornu-damae]|uniref:Transcriptional regulator medusa n=1 Tax=Trichoderma cornu-damae TaxID=654480 RepID=A0A9P8TZ96_9HYPO|nr:transcriptional regulator medusa [Trichoderma cornu-damae]
MSAVKFQSPSYRLFENSKPVFFTNKPIIVDDDEFESPETLTLRYEEAVSAAHRGDLSRDSPLSDFDMAAFSKAQLPSTNGYDATRYQDAAYEQYPSQQFSAQQTEKFAQLNQQSFANNNAVAHYMPAGSTAVSFQPSSGIFGSKVYLKISSQDDLFALSSIQPLVLFGTVKCPVELIRDDAQESSGSAYSCSVDVPQRLVTGGNNSVPLSFVIEAPAGGEILRTVAGTFQYLEGSEDDITRASKPAKDDTTTPAPEIDQASPSPKTAAPPSAATNTYDYPPQANQYANTFPQGNADMITSYRTTSFTDPHYHHRRAHQGWGGYGSSLAGAGRSSSTFDTTTISSRSSLSHHLPIPPPGNAGTPQLVRTSTITSAGGNGAYHPMSLYTSKAVLRINGKLSEMAAKWTQEEWDNRRRIVLFTKFQQGAVLSVRFKPVAVNERPPNSICISCIWWAEKSECYVTSVDTIHLLEQLVAAPNRFSVEEKNRIRRNLEGFHPSTVSKAKAESEEFFKIIMAFPHPKPRNIEKDVKVFPWSALEPALKKIIGKYSASPSSILPPATSTAPVSTSSSYATLPTPPGHHGLGSQHGLSSQHADHHSQYPMPSGYGSAHHEAIPSPRSQASWAPASAYSAGAARGLSPTLRSHHSPQQPSSMRINTSAAQLPAVSAYDTRAAAASPYGSTGLHTPISHHPTAATPPRWDATPATYTDGGYPGLASQQAPGAASVYGASAYGDGPQRA